MNKLKLSNRLLKCADMITDGAKIVDIGTDHAYLPIYLVLNGKINYAIASDINPGPLRNADNNIEHYGLIPKIETRLSNGLQNINENEVDEVVIAGLGGNVIIDILESCNWKNKKIKKFIIQPMKYDSKLREYLANTGYVIKCEEACICSKKIYTVMLVEFTGIPYFLNNTEKYIGKIYKKINKDSIVYINKQIDDLINRRKGAFLKGLDYDVDQYDKIIGDLKKFLC